MQLIIQPLREDRSCLHFLKRQCNLMNVLYHTWACPTVKCVFDHTVQFIPSSEGTKPTSFQEFMAVMIKLHLNCPSQDLVHRLSVSQATIS